MSIPDDLLKLQDLYQRGGLTEAEFTLAKARVLGESAAGADARTGRRTGDLPSPAATAPAPPGGRSAPWPDSARGLVTFLLCVIAVLALLAAPTAYSAFERWLFSNVE